MQLSSFQNFQVIDEENENYRYCDDARLKQQRKKKTHKRIKIFYVIWLSLFEHNSIYKFCETAVSR